MKPDNIATFLDKKLSPQFEGEMGNRFNIGIEGTRINHGVQWAPLQKSIYSLPALRELLAASNRRYLEFLPVIEDPRAESDRLDKLSEPVELEGRRYSGFNLSDPGDENLLCSIVRGEFNISGLRNKTLRRHVPGLNSGQMSRALKRLRTHGLIKKIGHTSKYHRRRSVTALFIFLPENVRILLDRF